MPGHTPTAEQIPGVRQTHSYSITFLCEEKGFGYQMVGSKRTPQAWEWGHDWVNLHGRYLSSHTKKSWPRKSPNVQQRRMKFSWTTRNPDYTGRECRWMRHVHAQTGWVERLNQKPCLSLQSIGNRIEKSWTSDLEFTRGFQVSSCIYRTVSPETEAICPPSQHKNWAEDKKMAGRVLQQLVNSGWLQRPP